MAFIRISHYVNCVRQFAYLNNQGGTNTVVTEQPASVTLPIQSKILVVNASFKEYRTNPQGINGASIYTDVYENRNIFITADVDSGSETGRHIKVWWVAIGLAK